MEIEDDQIRKLAEDISQQIDNATRHIGGYNEEELKKITDYWSA
jgi:hypothetical protein